MKGLLLTRIPRLVHLPDILSSMSLVTWTCPWLWHSLAMSRSTPRSSSPSLVLVLLQVYTRISTNISHDFVNTVFGGPGRSLKDVQGLFYIFLGESPDPGWPGSYALLSWVQARRLLDWRPVSWSVAVGTREPIRG